MNEKGKLNMVYILLQFVMMLILVSLYLLYQNVLAEDMIRELNQDYAELKKEYESKF